MDVIQFSDIKRCVLCGKPVITDGKPAYGAEGDHRMHAQCERDYNQHWDEREEEMRYRASLASAVYPCWTDLGNWIPYDLESDGPTRDDLIRSCFLHECSKEWLAIQLKTSLTEVKKILASMDRKVQRARMVKSKQYKWLYRCLFMKSLTDSPFELLVPSPRLKKILPYIQGRHLLIGARLDRWETAV